MLQKFLFLFPLKYGVFSIAICSLFSSGIMMTIECNLLKHASGRQGNFGFVATYFLCSVILLNGIYKVTFRPYSIIDALSLFRTLATLSDAGALVDISRYRNVWKLCTLQSEAKSPVFYHNLNWSLLLVLRLVALWKVQAELRFRSTCRMRNKWSEKLKHNHILVLLRRVSRLLFVIKKFSKRSDSKSLSRL